MSLSDAAAFAQDPEVRGPLTAGLVAAAISIVYEDPLTAHHAARSALSYQVLRNPQYLADQFGWALSTNGTVVGKWVSNDKAGAIGDFAYVISTIWDAMAGPDPVEAP